MVTPNPLNNLTPEKEMELKKGIQSGMTEKKWSFNPADGSIKTYETTEEKGKLVPIDRPANKNCKSCYGRGYLGKDIRINYYVPCGCLFREKKKK